VGWSLMVMPRLDRPIPTERDSDLPVPRSLPWIFAGAAAAVGFLALVGPALGS